MVCLHVVDYYYFMSLSFPKMNEDASDSNASGSGAKEVEIVFKLHPHMKDSKDVLEVIKENSTRYERTNPRIESL